ncbi:putative ecto-NOX disulfide-thiol exchanger 2 [Operophtera brumata]|uniref:Putative ecto-NOX disulfide-thiol exchanger 2 n=1 Tax=Operophtera brumata TaxID=104452 RepID=A0A0L7KSB2_OPEBR|nr:putative ecto-NOX disulfide-thiol exchanger 2 [Operophtera brumata]
MMSLKTEVHQTGCDGCVRDTVDLENIKEEFNMLFDEEETDKIGQKLVSAEKYEQLKVENDTLICELEGYRNECHLAKDEAERKFEKFKAHYIAQQALHGGPNRPHQQRGTAAPPTPDEMKYMPQGQKTEAKLVAMLTAFLLAHPLGATIDYLASYVRSMIPGATHSSVNTVLIKYGDIFARQAKDRWAFVLFDIVKQEGH